MLKVPFCFQNGDDLKISFWAKAGGSLSGTPMIGQVFKIPLPVSKTSKLFEGRRPEFIFYPYFYTAKGDSSIVEVESTNGVIGKRKIVVYTPPGEFYVVLYIFTQSELIGSVLPQASISLHNTQ